MSTVLGFFQLALQSAAILYFSKFAFDHIYSRFQKTIDLVDNALKVSTNTMEDASAVAFEAQTMIKEASKVINKMSDQVPALVKESRHYIHEARQRRSSTLSQQSLERHVPRDTSPEPPETRLCCLPLG